MGKKTSFETVQSLELSEFAPLVKVQRCVHFDDFEEALKKKILVPQWLSNSRVRLGKKVLWFAPSQSMAEHNFYGNVTYSIDFVDVIRKFGSNMYLVDQAIYQRRSYTRVVITSSNYDGKLSRVDFYDEGSPLIISGARFEHVHQCMNAAAIGSHELQIAIEVDEAGCQWLFQHCQASGNDHSQVNIPYLGDKTRHDGKESNFKSYRCFKYNTAQNKECPYSWEAEEAEEHILIAQMSHHRLAPHRTGVRSSQRTTVRSSQRGYNNANSSPVFSSTFGEPIVRPSPLYVTTPAPRATSYYTDYSSPSFTKPQPKDESWCTIL